nr:glycosyl hydrolase [Pyrinomonadaceae bacterium]
LEFYYGFGEKALPTARQGQMMAMWNTDTYAYPPGLDPIYQDIPFFIALRQGKAYGLFFDNTYRTNFDMGKSDPARYTFGATGGELNYYVCTGGQQRTPKEVLREYTDLTGRTPLPPLWALGYQQSRWSYYPEARVRELASTFRRKRIPADVIYLDIDYMDGFRVFTWDKTRFPRPAEMIKDLRNEGFRTVVIIDPGVKVDENYPVYREGRAGNYFVKTKDGAEFHGHVWPGTCAFPDFTDARARGWFGSLYRKHLDEGIAGFWNDMNEPATFLPDKLDEPAITHHPGKTFPLDVRHAGDGLAGDHARYHNVYGMQMARATFEGLRRLQPNARPFVLTRAGYAGIQRYAAVWTGDNVASWEHLALTIPMLTNLSVSGVALIGADVGGFSGSPSGELYARWLQAAALTPLLRSHTEAGSRDQEPWSYGADYESINRQTIELRYQLLPYLYSLFEQQAATGAPVMRPLWFEYPSDVRTYLIEDQYLVGRDLLVAPVLREATAKRKVYFPRGDAWVDWWTGRRYEGGTEAEIDAPINRLPLFARVGATIPMQAVIQHTDQIIQTPLTLVIVPDAETKLTVIYQDGGDGYSTRDRKLTVMQSAQGLTILQSGDASLQPVRAVEILGMSALPKEIRSGGFLIQTGGLNGNTIRKGGEVIEGTTYDQAAKRLRFPVLESKQSTIKFSFVR